MSQQQRDAEEDARSRSARICLLPFFLFLQSRRSVRARTPSRRVGWRRLKHSYLEVLKKSIIFLRGRVENTLRKLKNELANNFERSTSTWGLSA